MGAGAWVESPSQALPLFGPARRVRRGHGVLFAPGTTPGVIRTWRSPLLGRGGMASLGQDYTLSILESPESSQVLGPAAAAVAAACGVVCGVDSPRRSHDMGGDVPPAGGLVAAAAVGDWGGKRPGGGGSSSALLPPPPPDSARLAWAALLASKSASVCQALRIGALKCQRHPNSPNPPPAPCAMVLAGPPNHMRAMLLSIMVEVSSRASTGASM